MNEQIGYLVPMTKGTKVVCKKCHKWTSKTHTAIPLYIANLGQYQQHCLKCGKSINPNANLYWPELFK